MRVVCPILQELMTDPVVCADGHSYERAAIERWFALGRWTSPLTNDRLSHRTLIPNIALRSLIENLENQMPLIQRQQTEQRRAQQLPNVDFFLASRVADDQANGLRKASRKRVPEDMMDIEAPAKMARKWNLNDEDMRGVASQRRSCSFTPKQLAEFEKMNFSLGGASSKAGSKLKKTKTQSAAEKKKVACSSSGVSSRASQPYFRSGSRAAPVPSGKGKPKNWMAHFSQEQLKRFEAEAALGREANSQKRLAKGKTLIRKRRYVKQKTRTKSRAPVSASSRGQWMQCFTPEELVKFSALAARGRLAKDKQKKQKSKPISSRSTTGTSRKLRGN